VVGFNLECYCCIVVGCSWSVDRVGAASQFNGLGNDANGCLDATSFDLLPTSKHSFLDPLSKSLDDQDLFWIIQVLKVQIDTGWKEVLPVPPVTLPCSLSVLLLTTARRDAQIFCWEMECNPGAILWEGKL